MPWFYILKRLVYGIVVVIGVAAIVFVATHLLADPARKMLPLTASEAQYQRLRADLGLNEPLPRQFAEYVADAARLDFGTSISRDQPATDVVLERLPTTLWLMLAGLCFALLLALPLGLLAATRPGSWLDSLTVSTSLAGLSLPQFWLGALLILVFAVHLGWLPTSGNVGLGSVILPAVALGLPIAGRLTQIVRSTVIDELQRPYVNTARSKGLGLPYILRRHVLRNALVPISSYFSLETAKAIGGSTVVVETVFAFPGIGYLAVEAAKADDIVLMQAIVIIVGLLIVASNLLFDLFHAAVDPRIQLAQ
jgi:peptide/nickel transport system permease protein